MGRFLNVPLGYTLKDYITADFEKEKRRYHYRQWIRKHIFSVAVNSFSENVKTSFIIFHRRSNIRIQISIENQKNMINVFFKNFQVIFPFTVKKFPEFAHYHMLYYYQ